MKVLVATHETQGQRDNDFAWFDEDEILYIGFTCDTDLRNGPDGGCGCGRSFAGTKTRKAGTTAKVVDMDLTVPEFRTIISLALVAGGWIEANSEDPDDVAWVQESSDEMLRIASHFDVGTVVERRLDDIVERGAAVTIR